MTKHVVTDGTEHHADVLFTELVVCERDGDIFRTAARSKNYQRSGAMTADYVRELVGKLSVLLAEYDAERGATAPPVDDLELTRDGDAITFTLYVKKKVAGQGRVTKAAALKARDWLDDNLPPSKVVKLRRDGAQGSLIALLLALAPVIPV